MQKQYLALGSKEVYNGEYMLAVFHIEPSDDSESLASIATEVAAESSTGSNLFVESSTAFSHTLDALVYEIDEEKSLVYIGYQWRMFDSGGNVQNILTFVAGNIFGISSVKSCKLLDVYFPPQMLAQYDGPSYNLHDMREYLGVYDSPILGSIIKPKIGLTATEYAELCHDFWAAGGHFVKNDEPQADQKYAPYNDMVDAVRNAMDVAEQKTGQPKVHSFNVSAPDFDEMIRRADYVQKTMKPGSYAFLIDGITAGWMAVQTLRKRYPEVFLHFHRAGHGAFTRPENPIGFTVSVMTKFARLAGASGIHTGTAGVGKMKGDPTEDVRAMQHCLRLKSKGEFFEQVWATVPEQDSDIQTMIRSEQSQWDMGARELSLVRKETESIDPHTTTVSADWRTMKSCTPIISGGLNPIRLPEFLEVTQTIDFITTMGGGIHSHPMATGSGTKAVIEAYRGWQNGMTLEEAAEDGKGYDTELKKAIEFYGKKKEKSEVGHDDGKFPAFNDPA